MPPRTREAAFRVIPAYYSVQRNNTVISLPATDNRKAKYHRHISHSRDEGAVYVYKIDDSVPVADQLLLVKGETFPCTYVWLWRPKGSKYQTWVAVSSTPPDPAGETTSPILAFRNCNGLT